MEGFPNKIQDKIILLSPKPLPLPDSPSTCSSRFFCETPPKPVPLPSIVPEIINRAKLSKTKSPVLSPFARYTRKQNESLLSVVTMNKTDKATTPTIKSPKSVNEEVDQYGFYVVQSRELHNLQNNSVPLRSFNTETDAMNEWKLIINNNVQLSDIPMLLVQRGIPHPFRKQVWKYLACLHENKKASYDNTNTSKKIMQSGDAKGDATVQYQFLCEQQTADESAITQIELDISRSFPTHVMYHEDNSLGQQRLRRVLTAYANYNPEVGYCQGMSYIAALFLMYMEEAECFWLLEWLLQKSRMGDNYTKSMSGILTNSAIFDELLHIHYPLVYQQFQKLGIHPLMYVTSWYITLFTQLNSWQTVLRFFDLLFFYGPTALFRLSLGLIHLCQESILKFTSLDQLLPFIQSIPVECCDDPLLFPLCGSYPIDIYVAHAKERLDSLEKVKNTQKAMTAQPPRRTARRTSIQRPAATPMESRSQNGSSFFDKVFSTFSATPKSTSVKRPRLPNQSPANSPMKRRKVSIENEGTPLRSKKDTRSMNSQRDQENRPTNLVSFLTNSSDPADLSKDISKHKFEKSSLMEADASVTSPTRANQTTFETLSHIF